MTSTTSVTSPAPNPTALSGIPSASSPRFATAGRRVRLTIGKHTRDNWIVTAASTKPLPAYVLDRQSRDYKKMREASDI